MSSNNSNHTTVVEHDFLGIYSRSTPQPSSSSSSSSNHHHHHRGIQQAAAMHSRTNPAMLNNVIASPTAALPAINRTPARSWFAPLPVLSLTYGSRPPPARATPPASPLTIFYNGTVNVFDLPPHMADEIIKTAAEFSNRSRNTAESSMPPLLLENFNTEEGLPVAGRKSLQRFFQKRKERQLN